MANPTLLTRPLCENADKNTIPPTDAGTSGLFSEEYGFQDINSLPLASGGKAPNRRDFNGVFALLGGIAYACQRGQSFEWVATLPYLAGCVVTDPLDGNKYNAKNDVPEGGTNPSLDPTNWELFGEVVDISGKANVSLDNLNSTGENKLTSMRQVDYSAGVSISAFPYTVPSDGIIVGYFETANNTGYRVVYDNGHYVMGYGCINSASPIYGSGVVNKGATLTISASVVGTIIFYPFIG